MIKDFVAPIAVLSLICLIISGALAVGNNITHPVIMAAANDRTDHAMREIIPHAEGFYLIESDELPRTVTAAYGTLNGAGYIFMVTTAGYDGDIKLLCGIGADGRIIRSITLSHSETKGLGTVILDMEYQYSGKDRNLEGIEAVSGATITFDAYVKGIHDAFDAFDIVHSVK